MQAGAPAIDCDVFVAGGGPAGSTVATLLADAGWRVTLCDKDCHPRFHIGESLLPMNLPLFERLGVLDAVRAIGVEKHGADFSSPTHPNGTRTVVFADALDARETASFQVRRDQLDQLLLRNAAAHGVTVHENTRVVDVAVAADGSSRVSARCNGAAESSWHCRYFVDASGRDTLLADKLRLKRRDARHRSAAVYAHYRGVARREGHAAGNISIYWLRHGWAWMIPLPGGLMSVGVVCSPEHMKTRRGTRHEFMLETLRESAEANARMRDAERVGDSGAAGNYSYRATRMHGRGFVLVGDAYAFVDPIFSSGVFLAMNSASLAADAVDAQLRGSPQAARLMRRFDSRVRRGCSVFSWFIYRFATPALHNLFMAPRNVLGARAAVTSVFAGDIYRPRLTALPLSVFKAVYFVTAMVHRKRAWFARASADDAQLPRAASGSSH